MTRRWGFVSIGYWSVGRGVHINPSTGRPDTGTMDMYGNRQAERRRTSQVSPRDFAIASPHPGTSKERRTATGRRTADCVVGAVVSGEPLTLCPRLTSPHLTQEQAVEETTRTCDCVDWVRGSHSPFMILTHTAPLLH